MSKRTRSVSTSVTTVSKSIAEEVDLDISAAKRRRNNKQQRVTLDEVSTITATSVSTTTSFVGEHGFSWIEYETLYIYDSPKLKASSLIASFDMDDTLITTKSGKTFASGRHDWQWLYPSIPTKLRELYNDGYKILLFTNQNGISTGKVTSAILRGKIQDIINDLKIPIQVFVATTDDLYRKPSTNMWKYFLSNHNANIATIDLNKSFYIGDAAGRAKGWDGKLTTKKDFSSSDRKFAHNIGLRFHTPEEYFLSHPVAPFNWDNDKIDAIFAKLSDSSESASSSSSVTISASSSSSAVISLPSLPKEYSKQGQEIVLLVGYPASGKSTFSKRHFVPHGYIHINQDTMKTKEKCIKEAKNAVANGHSIVVDNTNPQKSTRKEYISIAKSKNIPIRCYYVTTEKEVAQHMNMYREKITNGIHKHVSSIAYNMFKSKFEAPTVAEGFQEVICINPIVDEPCFETEGAKKLFYEKS